ERPLVLVEGDARAAPRAHRPREPVVVRVRVGEHHVRQALARDAYVLRGLAQRVAGGGRVDPRVHQRVPRVALDHPRGHLAGGEGEGDGDAVDAGRDLDGGRGHAHSSGKKGRRASAGSPSSFAGAKRLPCFASSARSRATTSAAPTVSTYQNGPPRKGGKPIPITAPTSPSRALCSTPSSRVRTASFTII